MAVSACSLLGNPAMVRWHPQGRGASRQRVRAPLPEGTVGDGARSRSAPALTRPSKIPQTYCEPSRHLSGQEIAQKQQRLNTASTSLTRSGGSRLQSRGLCGSVSSATGWSDSAGSLWGMEEATAEIARWMCTQCGEENNMERAGCFECGAAKPGHDIERATTAPVGNPLAISATQFAHKARMVLPLGGLEVTSVTKPLEGETAPEEVRAEVRWCLSGMLPHVRMEWERLRAHEQIFFGRVEAPEVFFEGKVDDLSVSEFPERYGITLFRSAEILEIVDDAGTVVGDPNPAHLDQKSFKKWLEEVDLNGEHAATMVKEFKTVADFLEFIASLGGFESEPLRKEMKRRWNLPRWKSIAILHRAEKTQKEAIKRPVGDNRVARVLLDRVQYLLDSEDAGGIGRSPIYKMFNVVMRRRPKVIELAELAQRRSDTKLVYRKSPIDPAVRSMFGDEEDHREAIRAELIKLVGGPMEAFRMMDLNGSGRISMQEFKDGFERIGVQWQAITGFRCILQLFVLFNQHKDGVISLDELFPPDAVCQVLKRPSTPDFWNRWCDFSDRYTDQSVNYERSPVWDGAEPHIELKRLFKAKKTQAATASHRKWMASMFGRLKGRGKSDAQVRECIASHLPRGTGPKDRQAVKAFSQVEVKNCRKEYQEGMQGHVKMIQKEVYSMREQRQKLLDARHQLFTITGPLLAAQRFDDDSKKAASGLMSFMGSPKSMCHQAGDDESFSGSAIDGDAVLDLGTVLTAARAQTPEKTVKHHPSKITAA